MMIKLIVRLSGVDPISGNDVHISCHESDQFEHDYLLFLINKVLDEGAKYDGKNGLEELRALHAKLTVAISADEFAFRPAFNLDARTISRLSSAGASFDFDPYV